MGKMSMKDSLKKMIIAHRTGDQATFTAAVREIISLERGGGHNNIADELEKVLVNGFRQSSKSEIKSINLNYPQVSKSIPLSKGDQFPLLEIKQSLLDFHDIILDHSTEQRLRRIIQEQVHKNELANYGLQPVSKVLFYGPPGCGKTLAANVLTGNLGWSMFYVRFDSVISSYLGETSANLRKVFDFATNGPSILFFDEFDAIGKSRDAFEEVGELKRVVNSFLQMMDNFQTRGILITATNHEKLLDSALWRRFDEVVLFPLPSFHEIEKLLDMRLGNVNSRDFVPRYMAEYFIDLSYSDITRICTDAVKKMVLDNRSHLIKKDIIEGIAWFKENRPK
jgi:SpoVK/Ycf46/Vps4 family AAA+-type ATPase